MVDHCSPGGEPTGAPRRATVRISKARMREAAIQLSDRQGKAVVSEHIYEQRLRHCRACPHYQFDATCRICGGLVPVRARLAEEQCPDPLGAKW